MGSMTRDDQNQNPENENANDQNPENQNALDQHHKHQNPGPQQLPPPAHHPRRLLLLYGSQTGTAADVAEKIARLALLRHYVPCLQPMDNYSLDLLPSEPRVLLVASTTGQGEAPSNMRLFWRRLLRKSLPSDWLAQVKYAVFGLGDSGYPKFNIAAKRLDRRMLDLGATPILPRGLGDDQHPYGYEAALDPWLSSLWPLLRALTPLPPPLSDPSPTPSSSSVLPPLGPSKLRVKIKLPPSGPSPATPSLPPPTSVETTWQQYAAAMAMMDAALEGAPTLPPVVAPTRPSSLETPEDPPGATGCQGHNSASLSKLRGLSLCPVLTNRRLTASDHWQDVRHIEFGIDAKSVSFSPGDIVSIMPQQSPSALLSFLQRCSLPPDAGIKVGSQRGRAEPKLSTLNSKP